MRRPRLAFPVKVYHEAVAGEMLLTVNNQGIDIKRRMEIFDRWTYLVVTFVFSIRNTLHDGAFRHC